MSLHQNETKRRFRIERLEERIAPTACCNPCRGSKHSNKSSKKSHKSSKHSHKSSKKSHGSKKSHASKCR